MVNGGIRSGAKVEIDKFPSNTNCVFLDDSFYSGTTRDSIIKSLQRCGSYVLSDSYVIYDGSKTVGKDTNVHSMFRYYNQPENDLKSLLDGI